MHCFSCRFTCACRHQRRISCMVFHPRIMYYVSCFIYQLSVFIFKGCIRCLPYVSIHEVLISVQGSAKHCMCRAGKGHRGYASWLPGIDRLAVELFLRRPRLRHRAGWCVFACRWRCSNYFCSPGNHSGRWSCLEGHAQLQRPQRNLTLQPLHECRAA